MTAPVSGSRVARSLSSLATWVSSIWLLACSARSSSRARLGVAELARGGVKRAQGADHDPVAHPQRDARVEAHRDRAAGERAVIKAGVGGRVGADDALVAVDDQPAHRVLARMLGQGRVFRRDPVLGLGIEDVDGRALSAGDVGGQAAKRGQAGIGRALEHTEPKDRVLASGRCRDRT